MNYCVVKVSIKECKNGVHLRNVEPTGAVRKAILDFIYEKEGRVYIDRKLWHPSHLVLAVQSRINCLEITRDLAMKLLVYSLHEALPRQKQNQNGQKNDESVDGISGQLDKICIQCDKHHFVVLDYRTTPLEKDAVEWAFKQFGEITGYVKDDKGGIRFLLTRRNRRPLKEIPASYRMRIVDGPRELAKLTQCELDEFAKAPRLHFKRPAMQPPQPPPPEFANALRELCNVQSLMLKQPKMEPLPLPLPISQPLGGEFGFPVMPKSEPKYEFEESDDGGTGQHEDMIQQPHHTEPNHLVKLRVRRTHRSAYSSTRNYEDFFMWLEDCGRTDYKMALKKIGPGPSRRTELEIDFEFTSCQSMITMTKELTTACYFVDTFRTSFMFHAYKITLANRFDELDLEDLFIVVQNEDGVQADKDGCYLVLPRGQESPRDVAWVTVIEDMFLDPTTSRRLLRRELGIINKHCSSHVRVKDEKFLF